MKNSAKKTLIFLPGWGFKSSIWQASAKLLTHYEVKTIDLPMLSDNHNLDSVIKKLNKTIPKNSTIIAWSLSGLIAIYFCYCLPHKCAKLILVNSLPKFIATPDWIGIPPEFARRFQHKAKTDIAKLLTHFIKLMQYPGSSTSINSYASLHTLDAGENYLMLTNYLNFIIKADYCHLFKKLAMPVYCIFGADDAIIPTQAIAQLATLNPNIRVNIIPGCGHIPFLSHQKIFTQLLTGVLNE